MSVELEEIGSRIPDVPEVAAGPGTPGGYGRLPALARWWRAVSPDVGAAPSSVRHLWGDGGPAASSVVTTTLTSEPFTVPGTVEEALDWGVRAADHAADDGVSLLIVSVPSGPVLTLAGHLLGLAPVTALGWPKDLGLTDAEWIARVATARDGLKRIRELAWPTSRQLLDAVGSPELAAGVAVLLQATARTTPVLLDGPGATVSALMARHVARRSIGWMQAASDSGGRVQRDALDALRLEPLTTLDVAAEDGTAGVLALGLISAAVLLPAPAPSAPEPRPEPDAVIDVRGPFLADTGEDSPGAGAPTSFPGPELDVFTADDVEPPLPAADAPAVGVQSFASEPAPDESSAGEPTTPQPGPDSDLDSGLDLAPDPDPDLGPDPDAEHHGVTSQDSGAHGVTSLHSPTDPEAGPIDPAPTDDDSAPPRGEGA